MSNVKMLTDKFNRKFNCSVTNTQIVSFLRNHGIKCGRTGQFEQGHQPWHSGTKGVRKTNSGSFKKGHIHAEAKSVGTERLTASGYTEIKTAEPNVWTLKQRVVYAEHYGSLDDDQVIRFRDGDITNFDIENLVAVSRSESAYLTRLGLASAHEELKDTVVLVAKVTAKTQQLTQR